MQKDSIEALHQYIEILWYRKPVSLASPIIIIIIVIIIITECYAIVGQLLYERSVTF